MFDVYSTVRFVESDGVHIAVAEHGDPAGTPVLLIHGFPDTARLWRHQVPALVDAGYRVLAPDLRGYGKSTRPADVGGYALHVVASDMLAALDDAGVDRAHVVGHDWGAATAWFLAIAHPNRLHSLTALSVGHPAAFRRAGVRQLEKSWYMLLFQFEDVAEQWLSQDDWNAFRRWVGRHPETEHWIENLSAPEALTAALGIYRANMSPERLLRPLPDLPPVQVPVMGVWSSGDMALLESQMTGSAEHVAAPWRYERIEDVSHWIPLDAPDELNAVLLDWFDQHGPQ